MLTRSFMGYSLAALAVIATNNVSFFSSKVQVAPETPDRQGRPYVSQNPPPAVCGLQTNLSFTDLQTECKNV